VGVIEKRDFILSLTDEETLRRPRLPFWHIDYFTQPQLDDPEFFLAPDWPLPDDLGPPVDVLGMPPVSDWAAVQLRPTRLCPSPPPERVEEKAESSMAVTQSSRSPLPSEGKSENWTQSEKSQQSVYSELMSQRSAHSGQKSPTHSVQENVSAHNASVQELSADNVLAHNVSAQDVSAKEESAKDESAEGVATPVSQSQSPSPNTDVLT